MEEGKGYEELRLVYFNFFSIRCEILKIMNKLILFCR